MKQETAAVIANTELMPQVHLIWLGCPQIATPARPGQFVMVRCGEGFEHPLRRPLSIHQLDGNKLALLFNVVGKGTRWLAQRQAGESLDILGPLGNGFNIQPGSQNLLLVAGGVGIAPIHFLAQEAVTRQCSVTLIHGASSTINLYPEKMPPGIELVTVTEDGTAGKKGMITDLLPDFAGGADQLFACGPIPMYRTMARMPELKNKPVQISLEVRMGCGLGICYGCTVRTRKGLKQVCQHGPIFALDDIIWEEMADI